jgi:hypothetical protein
MYLLINVICMVIFIEATTNILSKSELFSPFREYLFKKSSNKFFEFVHSIFECPYCLSVWVSLLSISVAYLCFNNVIFKWFILVIVFHRLSNMLHFIIDRLHGKGKG